MVSHLRGAVRACSGSVQCERAVRACSGSVQWERAVEYGMQAAGRLEAREMKCSSTWDHTLRGDTLGGWAPPNLWHPPAPRPSKRKPAADHQGPAKRE